MKYKIVKDADYSYVEMRVNDLLAAGWKLHGPLQLAGTHQVSIVFYVQAMVRED